LSAFSFGQDNRRTRQGDATVRNDAFLDRRASRVQAVVQTVLAFTSTSVEPPVADLRVGDIFDGPSYMIVLPGSTSGTITSFVNRKLEHYNIKLRPASRSEPGDVQVHDLVGGETSLSSLRMQFLSIGIAPPWRQ
jgi:hypothetical protein